MKELYKEREIKNKKGHSEELFGFIGNKNTWTFRKLFKRNHDIYIKLYFKDNQIVSYIMSLFGMTLYVFLL